VNFNSPYKATSVIDYWQRWHMTLTRYLMMYLYTPIAISVARWRLAHGRGTSRAAYRTPGGFAAMVLLPVFVTFVLAGIWHGAGAQFLLFGVLHATYLSANHAWRILRPRRAAGLAPRYGAQLGAGVLTYLCVLVGSVVFRAPSVAAAVTLLGGMLGAHGAGPGFPVPAWAAQQTGAVGAALHAHGAMVIARWQDTAHALETILALGALYAIVWLLPNTQQIFADHHPAIDGAPCVRFAWFRWRSNLAWALALGCATVIGLLSVGGTSEFLYFQF
jgi:hypothetical protein